MENVEKFLEETYTRADWGMIPSHMHQALKDYIEHGWQPGSFLTSMLQNDIYNAVWKADHINEGAISDWVKFLQWYIPTECFGNEEKVRDWIARGGYLGKHDTVVVNEISMP